MSQENVEKLQDELFKVRLNQRSEALVKLLARFEGPDRKLHEAQTSICDVDREIIHVEDSVDAEINRLRTSTLEKLNGFNSEIQESLVTHRGEASAAISVCFGDFWTRISTTIQELVSRRDLAMREVCQKYDEKLQALVSSHALSRKECIERIEVLRLKLEERKKVLSRESSRLANIRRKTNTILGPYQAQQNAIASMESHLDAHRLTVLPQLEPLKKKYTELTKELKDAKYELELLTQRKEILDNFDSASVSTCVTIH